MSIRRTHTALPECPALKDDMLLPVYNRKDWDSRAAAALRSHLFSHGRKVGRRAGERWSPTIGAVRRTYGYRKVPPWSYLSFKAWGGERGSPGYKREIYGFVPADYQSAEEIEGLAALKRVRALFGDGEKSPSGGVVSILL